MLEKLRKSNVGRAKFIKINSCMISAINRETESHLMSSVLIKLTKIYCVIEYFIIYKHINPTSFNFFQLVLL